MKTVPFNSVLQNFTFDEHIEKHAKKTPSHCSNQK